MRLPPALWVLLFAGAMAAVDRVSSGPLGFSFRGQSAAAWVLVLAGLAVAMAGIVAFRRAKTTVDPTQPEKASALVTGGIYKITRNPMYVGMALVLAGGAVALGSWPAVLLVPVFMVVLTFSQIKREEEALLALFGAPYDRYMRKVPRWFFR